MQELEKRRTAATFEVSLGHHYSFVVAALDGTGTEAAESAPFSVDIPRSASSLKLSVTPTSGRHPLTVRLTAVLSPKDKSVTLDIPASALSGDATISVMPTTPPVELAAFSPAGPTEWSNRHRRC